MPGEAKQVIVVRKDLNMRKGKIAAQVAHAAMKFLLDGADWGSPSSDEHTMTATLTDVQRQWAEGLFTKVVVSVGSEKALRDLICQGFAAGLTVSPVEDAGLTEFHGVRTLTCAAFGPDEAERIDAVTGGCKLL